MKTVSRDTPRFLLLSFMAILTTLTILNTGPGPDSGRYKDWAEFFQSKNLGSFSDYPMRAASGQPLLSWSYGPGLIWSSLTTIFSTGTVISPETAGRVLGLLNLFLGFLLMQAIPKKSIRAKLTFTILLLSCTPVGFYFNRLSTEGLTITCLLIFFIAVNSIRTNRYLGLIAGISLYFLLLIRPSYLPVICLLISYLIIEVSAFNKKFRTILFVVVPVLMGVYFTVRVNVLLTGQFSGAYDGRDDKYSLISFRHLRLYEVLFSPWHGLLIYCPLFLILFRLVTKTLVIEITNSQYRQSLKLLVGIGTFVITLITQSAWAGWWMGRGTYGARQFTGVSIIMFIVLFNSERQIIQNKHAAHCIFIFLTIFGTSIYLLGESNFNTYQSLVSHVSSKLVENMVTIMAIAFATLTIKVILDFAKIHIQLFDLTLISLLSYLVLETSKNFRSVSLSVFFSFLIVGLYANHKSRSTVTKFGTKILIVVLMFVMIQSIDSQLFLINQLRLKSLITNGETQDIYCPEWMASLNEYNFVEGFANSKRDLFLFLQRMGCH